MKKRKFKDWDTGSIEGMEDTATRWADGSCNLKIRGEWLEVVWDGKSFKYKWGKNFIPRQTAVEVHSTK